VEELETTNEELQATNEELETMNEELQSTNEELQTMNDELRDRTGKLNRLNAFMEAVFTSLRQAVAAIDRDLKVLVWNAYAEELWGLRRDEVEGNHLLSLDFGLPLDEIKLLVRSCLEGGDPEPLTVDAVNRRGRAIRATVDCTPLVAPGGAREGVIMAMVEAAG
jgi:two-component system CheB/CheR fusion protein